MNRNWTLACQFSKNYNRLGPASPFIQSGNGLAFEGERWPVLFSNAKEPLKMDRVIYRLITYLAIGLVVAYLWVNRAPLVFQLQRGIQDWWK